MFDSWIKDQGGGGGGGGGGGAAFMRGGGGGGGDQPSWFYVHLVSTTWLPKMGRQPSKWNWESSWCPLCCQWWHQQLLSGQMLVAAVIILCRNIPVHSQQVYSLHMAVDNLLCINLRGSIIQRCTHGAQTNHTMETARLSLLTPKKITSVNGDKHYHPI